MTGEWFGTEEVTGFRLLSLFHVPSDFFVLFYSLAAFFLREPEIGLEGFQSRFK
jgi:hypothetical protein